MSSVRIREATPADAEAVTTIFRATYDHYPYRDYVEPDRLRDNIRNDPSEQVLVVELEADTHDGNAIEADTDYPVVDGIVGTGTVKFRADGDIVELGGAAIHPDFRGIDGAEGNSAYDDLLLERWHYAREAGADIVKTRANSSIHAITQHKFDGHDFVSVGLSLQKYPEVFPGEGRETVVPMVDAESDYRETADRRPADHRTEDRQPGDRGGDDDSPTVYVEDRAAPLVEHVLNRLDDYREAAAVRREVVVPDIDDAVAADGSGDGAVPTDGFSVDETVDRDVNEIAELTVVPGGDRDLAGLERRVESYLDDEDVAHVSVELDAAHPSTARLGRRLQSLGFDLERFEPEAFRVGAGEPTDLLAYQAHASREKEIQLIDPAVELVGEMDLDHTVLDRETPVDYVEHVRF